MRTTTATFLLNIVTICLLMGICPLGAAEKPPSERRFTNTVGMEFVRIEPGSFQMGSAAGGDFDERPVHKVNISQAFYMATTEVTNEQFERFDRSHMHFRGKHELSGASDQAVIYLSWNEAMEFCEWLSEKEGLPYRLPTEAEWEFACRAGTTSDFHTGNELPEIYMKQQQRAGFPNKVDLTVAGTPANPWGLYDMHGNVEEWCLDGYGPYLQKEQSDPLGRVEGDFRVTRGGSHNTAVEYLRSANRMGTLPEDKHWLIGFRVALGKMPKSAPLEAVRPGLWSRDVEQESHDGSDGPDPKKPYFYGPRNFVKIPPNSTGPLWSHHNHQPAITACPNGDLLAIWYSTTGENGRNLTVVGSRLRRGKKEWEPAATFWDVPDRNDHGSSLLWDRRSDTIYHFNGLSTSATWKNLALIMRSSKDNGATWSRARIIQPVHEFRHQVIAGPFITREGYLVVPCDAVPGGSGGSAVHISTDAGLNWNDPGEGRPVPQFKQGNTGAWIAGIHTGCTQLRDGSLLAFGRGDNIDGKMPKSISKDMGKNWTYSASELPGIGGGQRLVLLRLQEGPLFLGSFAPKDAVMHKDSSGKERPIQGFFGAVSYDEGKTWPVKRLLSDDGPGRTCQSTNGRDFTMSFSEGEQGGYFACTQSPNGVIQLISSWNHYAFNLKWLETPAPSEPVSGPGG